MAFLRRIRARLDKGAHWLCLGTLGLVVLWNWRAWRRDRALAERVRQEEPDTVELRGTPRVSVLVAAWNEARVIQRHIESFLCLRYPRRQLILCAGGCDGTYEIARRYASHEVTVLEQHKGEGKQRALRRCLACADGKILYLSDADQLLDDESFEQTIAPLVEGREKAATGVTRPLPEQMDNPLVLYQWFGEAYAVSPIKTYTSVVRGCNCAISREALESIGGFSEDVPIGTDDHLARKLRAQGIRIRFVRHSAVANEYPGDFHSYSLQKGRWLRVGLMRSLAEGNTLSPTVLGFLLYISPALCAAASPLLGKGALHVAGVLLTHLLLARIRSISYAQGYLGQSFPGRYYPRLALYVVVDVLVRLSAIGQLLRSRTRTRW